MTWKIGPYLWIFLALALVTLSCQRVGISQAPASQQPPAYRLAYVEMREDTSTLWLSTPGRPQDRRSLGTFTHQPGFPLRGNASPNGQALALVQLPQGADRFTGARLLVVNSDGSGQRLLEEGIDYDIVPQWSPDGRTLAFVKHSETGPPGSQATSQLYTIGVDGINRRLLLEDDQALDLYLVGWHPDGRQLLYHRLVPEGDQLWAFDIEEGRDNPISTLSQGPAYGVHLSPGGDQVVASLRQGKDSFAVVAVGLEGQPRRTISEGNRKPSNAVFSPDGRRIAYDTEPREQQPRGLQLLEYATNNVALLAADEGSKDVPLSFSPDGKWLLVRQHEKERAPIYLLELGEEAKEYIVSNYWIEPIGWTRG